MRILPINVRKQRTIALAAVIVAAGVTIIFALALSASAQSEPWRAAVTGVSVAAGDNPGELVISWDAHPENPNDYRVKWAEEDGDFRPYGNSDWNAYPAGTTHTTLSALFRTPHFSRTLRLMIPSVGHVPPATVVRQ